MNFFKKLFSKKEKKESSEESVEIKLSAGDLPVCGQCGIKIYPGELGIVKFPKSGRDSMRYHKKCLRKLRKLSKHYQAHGKI